MSKNLLIDATHSEETRVAIVNNGALEDFESETAHKKPIKGNIYLGRIMRVEPSLQAAFVDFGGQRQGFLSYSEIHSDYFQFPNTDGKGFSEDRRYRIQDVIKRRQIILVQVVKEERGNKGAALTTYLSLPGRYCILMPNSGHRTAGISKKIVDTEDRQRLKEIIRNLEVPETMSLILRTAGQNRTKLEIKRDYDYLLKLWEEVRQLTLSSEAPSLIYAEGDLIKKAVRDLYSRDMDTIIVAGDEAYKAAKAFMKQIMPSHAKKVLPYKEGVTSLFQNYYVEEQIERMFHPTVSLPSGGSIVITPTEALVAIDVNSGKSTKEKHIDDTALKTNLEAAEEVARQMRLRDLGGIVVVDFIDMSNTQHIHQVEKRFREAIKLDRARIQLGKISSFGILELSRQRLNPSVLETHTVVCPHCSGTGFIRSIESTGVYLLRKIEFNLSENPLWTEIVVFVPLGVDQYLLNQKRASLLQIEARFDVSIYIKADPALTSPLFRIEVVSEKEASVPEELVEPLIPVPVPPEKESLKSVEEPSASPVEIPVKTRKRKRRKPPRASNVMVVPDDFNNGENKSEPEVIALEAGQYQKDETAPLNLQENDESIKKPKYPRRRRRFSRSPKNLQQSLDREKELEDK